MGWLRKALRRLFMPYHVLEREDRERAAWEKFGQPETLQRFWPKVTVRVVRRD